MVMPASATLVIDDAVDERRLRRPADLARLSVVVAATAAIILVAYVAQSTTSGLDQDISQGANRLPAAVLVAATILSGLGSLVLPAAAGVDLLARRRSRQLIEALAGLLAAVLLLGLANIAMTKFGSDRLLMAFSGTTPRSEAQPFNLLLSGLAAFATVARLMSRSLWQGATVVVTASVALADVIGGGITAASLGVSALVGWGVGLLIRYAVGTETTRPSGRKIADALAESGHRLSLLRASEVIDAGRRYEAQTTSGDWLDLIVFDRDLEGAGFLTSLYRSLRLRDIAGSGTSLRRRVDRTALISWAVQAAGAAAPRLHTVADVGADAAVMVFERIEGRPFAQMSPTIGDAELAGAWAIVRDLQQADIVHRALTAHNFTLGDDGRVYVHGLHDGAIAASDVMLRIDLAEALCTLSMLADVKRAVEAGRIVLGDAALARALPALQPFALSTVTRRALRKHDDLLSTLRSELITLLPTGEQEQVEIERIKPRTLVTIAAGTIAAYLLLTQFAQINIIDLFTKAHPLWVLIGLGLSCLTYVAATMVLGGIIPERISSWKLFQAQWAASFATLVAPPTLGSVAINVRFLTKQRISAALAGASIAVAQVLTTVSHVVLLVVTAIVAGTTQDLVFRPPRTALVSVVVVGIALAFAFTIPAVRRLASERLTPLVGQVIPRVSALANQPMKLVVCGIGVMLLNISYSLCLVASVRAYTDKGSVAAIMLVYLTTSVIAVAAPTPGGLGAIEAATIAGLTATGIDASIAVPATLLFRLWTFWFPTLPGWLAFNRLQAHGEL